MAAWTCMFMRERERERERFKGTKETKSFLTTNMYVRKFSINEIRIILTSTKLTFPRVSVC